MTARLLPNAARLYPALDPGTWYPIIESDEIGGLWLDAPGLGDSFVSPGRVYVFGRHCELRKG